HGGKPKLYYHNGRGRMEFIRWCLAAAGVQFEEKFLESAEDLEKLRNDGSLMFQQVPIVEIDGMKLVQTRAILNYIASKYNLYGKDIKERALYACYSKEVRHHHLHLPEIQRQSGKSERFMVKKLKHNFFFFFLHFKKSHRQDDLVGNELSRADIHLVELLYYVEELDSSLISSFRLLKGLKTRISNLPTVKKFLQPGSPRKPPMDAIPLEEARKTFGF
uniref:glutathione transferase n=1 Tax=Chlorocebus sabaeus TaxID=60711 RepID=A0A0D9RKW5_CHLSB